MARLLFYVVTVGAALVAVLGTSLPGDAGHELAQWSWYLLMGGLVFLALMLLSQAWLVLVVGRIEGAGPRGRLSRVGPARRTRLM